MSDTSDNKNGGQPKKIKKIPVAQRVREAVAPTVASLGYVLWDVELVSRGGELDLVVTIDRPGGVGIGDCETVTKAIDPIIDELDPLQEAYCLEVSSAGLERILRTPEQIEYCIGEKVDVRFYAAPGSGPFAGSKHAQAVLKACENDGIVLEKDGEEYFTPLSAVSRLGTVFPEDAFGS